MKIRLAKETDIPAIMDILNDSIINDIARFDDQIKTDESMIHWYRQHGEKYPIFVAVIDDCIVGWASIQPYSLRSGYRYTLDNSIYIHKNFRGQKIGDKLFDALIETSRQLGYHTIISSIVSSNIASINLHKKYGFISIGKMKEVGYKFEKWLDVDIMQLML